MTETLYHPEVFMPEWFEMSEHNMPVTYSNHAKRAAKTDRYGDMSLPPTFNLKEFNVVEIGVTNNTCTKIVARGPYDKYLDIVVVFIPQGLSGFVKTVWFNTWDDTHKTLDRSRYAKA